jgi:hypothetical protein
MQVEISGNWVYVYSGRTMNEKNPDLKEVGYKDPFEVVHCIRLDKITGLKVDHVFEDMSVTIFAEGHPYPIRLTFGSRNCYRINCHGAAVCKLQDALGIPREFVWDMNKRSEQTALSVQRADEAQEET